MASPEDQGLEVLADRSHKPKSITHPKPATVEAVVLELRGEQRSLGPRGLVFELLKLVVYRALNRGGLINIGGTERRKDTW